MKTMVEYGMTFELRVITDILQVVNVQGMGVYAKIRCPYCGTITVVPVRSKSMCVTYCPCWAKFSPHYPYVDGNTRYARSAQPITP